MTDWAAGLPLMIGPYEVGITETSPETVGYWDGVQRGELLVKRCRNCEEYLHPRRILCPNCRSDDISWQVSTGRGAIYSYSTVYHPASPEFVAPYTNGIIQVDEGPYLFGRILSDRIEDIVIGAHVQVEFGPVIQGGDILPMYRIA